MKKPEYRELSLLEFQEKYNSEETCRERIIEMRWPRGFVCPGCSSKRACYKPSREEFYCYDCSKVCSPTAGTLFHRSHVPLRKWFWAIYLVATSKKGVSALYLQKQLKLGSYNTAWMLLQKIRLAMANRDEQYTLSGLVSADEIHVGGKQKMKELQEKGTNKTPFFIAVKEDQIGNPKFVRFEQVNGVRKESDLLPAIKKNIQPGSIIKADGNPVYHEAVFQHDCVLEQAVALKNPEVAHGHLKWVNMLTSNLKRWLLSTHHGVFPEYRKHYVAEFAYRFNRRTWPGQAFERLLFANIFIGPTPLRAMRG